MWIKIQKPPFMRLLYRNKIIHRSKTYSCAKIKCVRIEDANARLTEFNLIIQNDDFHTDALSPLSARIVICIKSNPKYLTLFKLNKKAHSFKWNSSIRNQEQPKYIYLFITTAEWRYLFKVIHLFSCLIRFQPYWATIPQRIICFEAFSGMVLWLFLKMHVECAFLIFKKSFVIKNCKD